MKERLSSIPWARRHSEDVDQLVFADLFDFGVGAQGADLAANVDCALVHGVAQRFAGVAADDDAAFCIMKPVRNPVFPPTTIVPPFIDMPARAPAFPPMKSSPPRMVEPADAPASLATEIRPDIMLSPTAQPAFPAMATLGPSSRLAA